MVRVRFAPSPTGYLHIGNARTALFNYLFAKKNKGQFILRIEDTDQERSKTEFVTQICEDLRWLGLVWDEGPEQGGEYGPYRQSERGSYYSEYMTKLLQEDKAYYCYCTEEELEQRRQEQLAQGQSSRYDNRCRFLSDDEKGRLQASGVQPTIRFKMPDNNIIVKDLIRGEVEFDINVIGDFVIIRPDGTPTFHFAVCVDDGLMQISHVIRGEDHFSNTPRHVALFEACGFAVPQFAHMPLTMGPGGEPLSKRFGAVSIADYRRLGYLPVAVCNYIALLGWSPGDDRELFNFTELQETFSLKRISRSAAIFDRTKMNWLSGEHIRMLDDEEYIKRSIHYILEEEIVEHDVFKKRPEWYEKVVLIFKHTIHCFHDLADHLKIFSDEIEFEHPQVLATEQARLVITELVKVLKTTEKLDEDTFDKIFKQLKKRVKLKGKELFLPVRIALSGREHGPEIKQVVMLLGKNKCLERLDKALALSTTGGPT